MGQIQTPPSVPDILLTATDRLIARNADGGISPLAAHIILLGEVAGQNLGALDGVIALGGQALDAGFVDVQHMGVTAIGQNALSAATGGTNNDDATSGSIVMGRNAAAVAVCISGAVVIGVEALAHFIGDPAASGPERCVVIGNEACERLTGATQFTSNTIIGWRALRGAVGNVQSYSANVLIGDSIAASAVNALTGNTVVGAAAGIALGSGGINTPTQNTIIGQSAGAGIDHGDTNVVIGAAAGPTAGGVADQSNNVCVGANSVAYGSANVVIGKGAATSQFGVVGTRSIIIGYQAGQTLAGGTTDQLIIESFDAGVTRAGIYGDLAKGCIVLGGSNIGVDRDTGGAGATNLIKILNGTLGAAAPVGGVFLTATAGLFQVQIAGGALHTLTPTGVLVAALPAPFIGGRNFVTNALAPAFGVAVAGGGAVFTPVYSDGIGWFVG